MAQCSFREILVVVASACCSVLFLGSTIVIAWTINHQWSLPSSTSYDQPPTIAISPINHQRSINPSPPLDLSQPCCQILGSPSGQCPWYCWVTCLGAHGGRSSGSTGAKSHGAWEVVYGWLASGSGWLIVWSKDGWVLVNGDQCGSRMFNGGWCWRIMMWYAWCCLLYKYHQCSQSTFHMPASHDLSIISRKNRTLTPWLDTLIGFSWFPCTNTSRVAAWRAPPCPRP